MSLEIDETDFISHANSLKKIFDIASIQYLEQGGLDVDARNKSEITRRAAPIKPLGTPHSPK